jgi:predicted RNA-binding protein with RPS1 domain
MTGNDIQTIIKTASIVSATMLNIVSEKGKVTLSINDPKNSTSHSYKKPLGDADVSFNVKMAIDSFKVVPDEYNVRVANAVAKTGKVLVFFFEATGSDLTYLIAADSSSKV